MPQIQTFKLWSVLLLLFSIIFHRLRLCPQKTQNTFLARPGIEPGTSGAVVLKCDPLTAVPPRQLNNTYHIAPHHPPPRQCEFSHHAQNKRECGVQKRQTVPDFVKTRVNEADPGEFPWAVSLMINLKFSYTGTGSLIHDRVVLTAAHLLENKDLENLYAIVGEHDVFKKILPKKAMKVTEVVVHNKFVSSNGNYNFALAFLRSSATTNLPHVGTVCLPPADFVASAGASCAFSGWGTDSAQKQIVQLTKTEVPMMTHSACEQKLKQLFGPRFKLYASFTCAGGEVGRDICTGGGGSPLVCPIEGQDRYVQTWIVSWGTDGCGVDGTPLVFADVAAARPWIDQQMAEHLYSTASYTY
ncbi:hypothetical protein ABMA27_012769 [Loxostege sticticalis]|uniref:Peptidase S1 domain-containing protein n=1 Tax=Loxostege sticticalis TaxID=481309 RepID=A0ABR3H022_LOXSC